MLRFSSRMLKRNFVATPLTREAMSDDGIYTRKTYRNLDPAQYYEFSVTRPPANPNTPPSLLTSTGAFASYSGAKCGRSPLDKRIVEPLTKEEDDKIWWGAINKKMTRDQYDRVIQRAQDYLNNREEVFIVDGFVGWDPKYRKTVRIYCTRPYHALFMNNMLVRPTTKELDIYFSKPEFIIYNAGEFNANAGTTRRI